jgi:hypothetical protein
MKKTVLSLIVTLFLAIASLSARNNDSLKLYSRFLNLNYSSQTMTFKGLPNTGVVQDGTSEWGFGVTVGRSYLLNKKPIGDMVRIGSDAGWADVNFGRWAYTIPTTQSIKHLIMIQKIDISIGVGPSIHLNPVDKLGIHAYFRYNPTFSIIQHLMKWTNTTRYENDGGYASYFTAGGAISWDIFSLGIEARFGGGTYHLIDTTGTEIIQGTDYNLKIGRLFDNQKHWLSGLRAYIGFRF